MCKMISLLGLDVPKSAEWRDSAHMKKKKKKMI